MTTMASGDCRNLSSARPASGLALALCRDHPGSIIPPQAIDRLKSWSNHFFEDIDIWVLKLIPPLAL